MQRIKIAAARDAIRPKKNVHLTIPAPSFLEGQLTGVLYRCDGGQTTAVTVRRDEETVLCTIPEIGLGAVLVISSQGQRR